MMTRIKIITQLCLLFCAVATVTPSVITKPCQGEHCKVKAEGHETLELLDAPMIWNCSVEEDCDLLLNNSVCIGRQCHCKQGYVIDSDDICRTVRLGQQCPFDEFCSSHMNHSTCIDGICQCNIGYRPLNSMVGCTHHSVGDMCLVHHDCPENSECFEGVCICPEGYRSSQNNTACFQVLLTDNCDSEIDCSTVNNSHCTQLGVCGCDKGFLPEETLAHCRPRMPGDVCITSSDCYLSVKHSVCKGGKCVCKNGFQFSTTLKECTLKRVGDTCNNDMECLLAVDSTECTNNTCSCLTGYMDVMEHSKCVKRNITSRCENDLDCNTFIMNSTCVNGTCKCVSGLKQLDSANICERRLVGEQCQFDADCEDSVRYSTCSSGICACSLGYQYINDLTCTVRHIGDACNSPEDCSHAVLNSTCSNGSCVCNQGYRVSPDALECNLNHINDLCEVNEDCSKAINASFCNDKTCRCNVGFQVSDDLNACNRRKIFDKTCVFHPDCSAVIENSRCVKYQCVCSAGFYPSSDNQTCTRFTIGDPGCKVKRRDCQLAVRRSQCVNGVCQCDVGYLSVDNGTECRKRIIGDSCERKADCKKAVYDSDCVNNTCTCTGDLEPLPDNSNCVPKPTQFLYDSCYFDEQCQRITNNSLCSKLFGVNYIWTCVCEEGYIFRKDRYEAGECYVPEKIGDYCKSLDWCKKKLGTNVVCNNNVCGCRQWHVHNLNSDGCVPYARKVGELCWTEDHCTHIVNSICDSARTCQCHYMYEPGPTNTSCIPSKVVFQPEVPDVSVGPVCDPYGLRTCSEDEYAVKYTRCGQVTDDVQSRCKCVPGYASRYDSDTFRCVDADTYVFTFNISSELGCNRSEVNVELHPLCYKYQPIRHLDEYKNPRHNLYIYTRKRIELNGVSYLTGETSSEIKRRYLKSEVINITETLGGMLVSLIVYIASEKYVIIEPTTLHYHILQSLIRNDGELGKSQLKVQRPYSEHVIFKDFDECTEQNGTYNDCSSLAWCLSTRVSYMCSCKYINVIDTSPDLDNRPGRICSVPVEETKHSLSCSNTKCETQWEYIGLGLVALIGLLFSFIGYEIYARKKELEKTDVYYAIHRASKKAKVKAQELRRKTMKATNREKQRRRRGQSRVTFDINAPEHII